MSSVETAPTVRSLQSNSPTEVPIVNLAHCCFLPTTRFLGITLKQLEALQTIICNENSNCRGPVKQTFTRAIKNLEKPINLLRLLESLPPNLQDTDKIEALKIECSRSTSRLEKSHSVEFAMLTEAEKNFISMLEFKRQVPGRLLFSKQELDDLHAILDSINFEYGEQIRTQGIASTYSKIGNAPKIKFRERDKSDLRSVFTKAFSLTEGSHSLDTSTSNRSAYRTKVATLMEFLIDFKPRK